MPDFIQLGPHNLEPRGDNPPEWDEPEGEIEAYEPEPPDPADAYLTEDWAW